MQEPPRVEGLALAHSLTERLHALEEQHARTRQQLDALTVRAPIDGRVERVTSEPAA